MFTTIWFHLMDIWSFLIDNIFYLNMVFAVLIVFFERRDPKVVWTWLLVMYFIPILGFFLYLVIGQDMHKQKMFKIKEIEDALNGAIKKQEDYIQQNRFRIDNNESRKYSDLVLFNLETSSAIYSDNNEVTVFNDGNEKFNDLIHEIRNAKKFIHIQYYIIKTDELFEKILDELIKKAKEGVEVRVLYDGMGGRNLKKKTIKKMKQNGIQTGIFFPAILGRLQPRFNYRNHRKIAVIDGKYAYVGGFNIGKEYIGKDKKFGYWRDTHLKIKGVAVLDLQIRFILDWNYATKENLIKNEKYMQIDDAINTEGEVGIQIVSSGPDSTSQTIRDNYLRLINKAEKSIYIHTPYFIPDESVLTALTIAAKSGIDVRLMIPCKPDHPFVYWSTHSFAGDLVMAGARVFKYEDGFLHAKGIMIDGEVCSYGTANMDMRSFALNFEVNAVIYNSDVTEELESQFLEDIDKCSELTKYDYVRRSMIIRIKEQVSRLLSPLL